MLKFLLLFVIYVVCFVVGMFTVHVIHYFVKRREYEDNDDMLNIAYKVKENARAEMLRELFFGKWLKLLVSKRYTLKKLQEQITERELRERFMNYPKVIFLIIRDYSSDLKLQISTDFRREVEMVVQKDLEANGYHKFNKDEIRQYLGL